MAKPGHEYFPAGQGHPMRRFEPGTGTTPDGVQIHDFCEEVYILDGVITGLRLDQACTAGMYVCRHRHAARPLTQPGRLPHLRSPHERTFPRRRLVKFCTRCLRGNGRDDGTTYVLAG